MDAVTDDILLLSDPLPWSGAGSFGVFWDLFAPRVEEIVSSYNFGNLPGGPTSGILFLPPAE
jgi:hypothetical protein